MVKYKMFDHTADIGMEICGRTKKELFVNAAGALFDLLIELKDKRKAVDREIKGRHKTLTIAGADVEDLLINFLRELLYLFHGKALVAGPIMITECTTKRLTAHLPVERYNETKHIMTTEIKAITYHGLRVEKQKASWKARVIFDV